MDSGLFLENRGTKYWQSFDTNLSKGFLFGTKIGLKKILNIHFYKNILYSRSPYLKMVSLFFFLCIIFFWVTLSLIWNLLFICLGSIVSPPKNKCDSVYFIASELKEKL